MKAAVICDLHLSFDTKSVQYDVFEWAIKDINKNEVDVLLVAGDQTANGDIKAVDKYLEIINKVNCPVFSVLGNSDVRTKENIDYVHQLESPKVQCICEKYVYAINTSHGVLADEDKEVLLNSVNNCIVLMHHPISELNENDRVFMEEWKENHNNSCIICGHLHKRIFDDKEFCVQALDPDKAIGEPPCITYFEFSENDIKSDFSYFPFEKAKDVNDYIGISCFNILEDIDFAIEKQIKNIELRPEAINMDVKDAIIAIEKFRMSGGRYVSLHMPDIGIDENGDFTPVEKWNLAVEFANNINVNGVTIHVPQVSVENMNQSSIFNKVVSFYCHYINKLPEDCVVGIENMHMTSKDKADDSRRFGYIPEECLLLINEINNKFAKNRVGMLLDVGHARNNPPFSQKYTISSWYYLVGKLTVGYHVHQVTINSDGSMNNHTVINNIFGPLISYCSFFYSWENDLINKCPVFMEIRGGIENYIPSIKSFAESDNREFE